MAGSEHVSEEFNNFMHRVTEIQNIIQKLNSDDKSTQEIGTVEADQYLRDSKTEIVENIDEKTVALQMKYDRTVINTKAFHENQDPGSQSQESFMKEVERDADKRYKDKQIRKERADTLKTQANKAFRRGEYEKALTLYNKAIEQINDSCVLYINRSLTQINLKLLDAAIKDAETALQLNENSLKARLLLAKAQYLNQDITAFQNSIAKAIETHGQEKSYINEFVEDLQTHKIEA